MNVCPRASAWKRSGVRLGDPIVEFVLEIPAEGNVIVSLLLAMKYRAKKVLRWFCT